MLRADAGAAASVEAQMRAWREQALTVALRAMLLVGSIAGAAMAYRAFGSASLWQIPLLVGAYGILAVGALWQRGPYFVRACLLFAMLHGLGASALALSEAPGIGLGMLLAALCLAVLLVGPRGALVSAGLTAGTLLVLASLAVLGPLTVASGWAGNAAHWLTMGPAYATLALAVGLATHTLQQRLLSGLQEARQLSAHLASEQGRLQREAAERTTQLELWAQYLEAITELTHSATALLDDPQGLLEHVVDLISERLAFYHTAVFLVDQDRTWLELQAASSDEGRQMAGKGYRLPLGSDGIVAQVAVEGVAQVTRGVREGMRTFEGPYLASTRSEVALPLRVRGETIGVLDVHSTEPGAFTDDDVSVLQILADQMAVALSNAQLSRQVRDSAAAMRQAYGEMGVQAWRSLLRSRGELSVRHDPSAILANGALTSVTHSAQAGSHTMANGGTQRAVAVPVQVRGGHAIGVVHAVKPDRSGEWSTEELELLHALVGQLGVALDSAQLYQESQERGERERLVSGMSARMRESLDVDSVLRTAVREIGELMGFAEVEVRMGNRGGAQP